MSKLEAKQQIARLVEKYNKIKEEGKIKTYNEEMTKKDFIQPLFHALGWDTQNSEEVNAEEHISAGRADYSFRINGIPKFFLEAKAMKVDLDDPKFVEQSINYSWHKGCTWAVLTDFEAVKIYNAEWKTGNPLQNHLKTIPYYEFLDRFEELWLLSKESFETGLIDKEAEKWGKKTKKIPVDKQLLNDFTRFRELLSKNIVKLNGNKNLTQDELDETVQRILDRLIFIRNCEDRGLEEKNLLSNLREEQSKGHTHLIKHIREVFTYYDENYNSKIFSPHLCDDIVIDDEILAEIIEGLYFTQDKSISYDFALIEADVLGNIYEQYLGHLLKKTETRAKLNESHQHRKEQGIYYTPTYIVDYIVRNTLGELLKKKNIDPDKIKILDPACGSGSFLIKAFDVLDEYYSKKDKKYSQTEVDFNTGSGFSRKTKILQNNIFGVDLDKKAVEIAQLNLLLKAAEKRHQLPLLQQNIKCGNSLIDDPAIAEDKAFKWGDEFKQIMDEGGFDVIVGNPPYISIESGFLKNELKYLYENFIVNRIYDTSAIFIEKALNLVKEGGYISFIVPSVILINLSFSELRKFILEKTKVKKIIQCGDNVFESATVPTCILILQKNTKKSDNTVTVYFKENRNLQNTFKLIRQNDFQKNKNFEFNIQQDNQTIINKITENSQTLSNYLLIKEGIKTGNDIEFIFNDNKGNKLKPLVKGRDISRYNTKQKLFIDYSVSRLARPQTIDLFEKVPKLLIRRVGKDIVANIDYEKTYCVHTLYVAHKKNNNLNLYYLLGILNSKLINYFRLKKFPPKGKVFPEIRIYQLYELPIKLAAESQQQYLAELVKKIIEYNKRLNVINEKKTEEKLKIEAEIKKTDIEIDNLIYKIYGISEKEKEIINKF